MNTPTATQATAAERAIFFIAGIFNGMVVLSLMTPNSPAWELIGVAAPEQTLFLHLFLVFAALFGLAYFWVAADMSGKNALILLAVLGKLAVVGVVIAHYLTGSVPVSVVSLTAGDLVFAGLFLGVLYRHRA